MQNQTQQNQTTKNPGAGTIGATEWDIDTAHSGAEFSIKHMMIAKVHGSFKISSGKLFFNKENPAQSSVEAVLDIASVDTREQKRDEHLMSPDFFDVKNYPTMTFKSTKVEKEGDEFLVTGDFHLHGVTKSIVLSVEGLDTEVKDPWGNTKMGASAKTKIKRKDFGLEWNTALETGGVLVGDDVTINLEISFLKKK